jgi:thiosulfate dehydrogenase
MSTSAALVLVMSVAVAIAGCRQSGASERGGVGASATATSSAAWDESRWTPPTLADLPGDSVGAAVRRGLALLTATHDSLPRFVGGNLNCTSCHLDEGRRATASPFAGVFARYPRYIDRAGAVVPIEDRVNYCFTRSLAGTRLPNDSREMQDLVAYFAFVSRGVPIGAAVQSTRMPPLPAGHGDSARGAATYRTACARCHGADGAGMAKVPAVWGPRSFSIGASMAREERAAAFIRRNMPFDKPGTLSDSDAYDVAAYITSQPRPDLPGKANDWPLGGAPADVPYDTKGHKAFRPPRVLPRRDTAGAHVPPPRTVARRAER